MWKYSLLLVVFLFGCVSNLKTEKTDFTNISIQCTLKNHNDIYISFRNRNDFSINIKKPCMFNTYINIQKDGKPLTTKIRVKASPECMYPIYNLDKNDSAEFKYNYELDELFDLEEDELYKISVEYYIYENNKLTQKIFSDGHDFIWNK